MGRRKRSAVKVFSQKKNFNRNQRKDYELPPRENELFNKYYKGLGIVPDGEWDLFYSTLQKTLPVTFRITGYKSEAQEILKNIKGNFFTELLNHKVDGEEIPPPMCLPWYPNELAWQLDLTRKVIRSSEHLSRLHDFLVAETECGAISRQEAVSMIPPLVLDVQPQHKVLDMCAAPGSKTAQLIEYLHSGCKNDELPSGYVIANDSDNRRCYMMVHQVKRLQSPCCVIVNHDATIFPKVRTNGNESSPEFQLFDRVLCDVPCSGDGTMRKNFDVWSKWHPLQGANMHGLQCKILRRGCQLLAKGGRLVYSTCSLNPVEDEAVISEILRSSEGAMELVDIRDELPGLKYAEGISAWKVMTKTGEWIATQEEVPTGMKTQYRSTIFPPTAEEAERFHLNKCIRILPHQQDTGGFFVAALRKVRHLPGSREAKEDEEKTKEEEKSEEAMEDKTENEDAVAVPDVESNKTYKKSAEKVGEEPQPKKRRIFGCFKEDPFFFMEVSDPAWPSLKSFFGFPDDFPPNQIMFRSQQGKRTLYFVSQAMREVVRYNTDNVKFINMGVKVFSRSPSPLVPQCDYRITQECLHTLRSSILHRKVSVSKQDAITIISEDNPFTHKLSSDAQKNLDELEPGSTVFIFNSSDDVPSPKCDIVFCGWRGKTSVRCFGSKVERSHMLMLLGEDLKEINRRVQEEKRAKQERSKQGKGANDDDLPPLDDDDEIQAEVGGDGEQEGKEENKVEQDKEKEVKNGNNIEEDAADEKGDETSEKMEQAD